MRRTLLLALFCLAALPALAAYSGLVVIPTADVLGAGAYDVTLQVDGTLPDRNISVYLLNTQYGLTDRLELGLDYDLSDGADPRALFNAKYLLPTGEEDGLPQLAVGVMNVGSGLKAIPYLVATRELGPVRGHLGVARMGEPQAFAGLDWSPADRWGLMADYTTSAANYASAGVWYQLTDDISLLAGTYFPNAGGATEFTLQLSVGGCVRCAGKGE